MNATPRPLSAPKQLLIASLACAATTLGATPLIGHLDEANIVMLFLLTVLLLGVGLGRTAAVWGAFLSVAMFDFFFVPPRFSLTVNDAQYLVTFVVMLLTALITGHLTAGLRQQAELAAEREAHTRHLYEMARELGSALTPEQVADITRQFLRRSLGVDARLILPDAEGKLPGQIGPLVEPHLALMAFNSGEPVDCGGFGDTAQATLYLPLRAPMRMRGVLAIIPESIDPDRLRQQRPLLETLASLVAIAVERQHYVTVAQTTQVEMSAERLRSSILSALSHDLRTPLTALVGLADSLSLIKPPLPEPALETAQAMHEQADRLAGLVGNLLDMARLQAGKINLRREWQPLEEVIGAAIKLLGPALDHHPVRVSLAPDLPLLAFDAVLIERVFCNLLENAAKYAPPDNPIDLSARCVGDWAEISVADRGCGFTGEPERFFELFVRGERESTRPGVGLGLAICRAVVEAHGGHIQADNREGGGARFVFTLPLGTPPVIEAEVL